MQVTQIYGLDESAYVKLEVTLTREDIENLKAFKHNSWPLTHTGYYDEGLGHKFLNLLVEEAEK